MGMIKAGQDKWNRDNGAGNGTDPICSRISLVLMMMLARGCQLVTSNGSTILVFLQPRQAPFCRLHAHVHVQYSAHTWKNMSQ